MKKCKWTYSEEDDLDTEFWATECGQSFVLMEGTPKENGMKFCCYCGREIKEPEQ